MIQAIDKTTIHQICSGQVVIDLATAVKELVENSLDSGATVVEVKLRNMGIDIIEVCDNGSGIDPLNYEGIAMKHHTSKLKDFEDVYSVSTFGFRGEALNSLCELSGAFSVATKQANNAVGSHLQFDQIGRVISRKVVARSVGTSVLVERLFEKLPVRRGELVRSAKKHYLKMLKVLQSYALISVGIKIVITNLTVDGGSGASSKQTVLATQLGTTSLLDTTSIVFGAAFAASLVPVSFSVQVDAETARMNMVARSPISAMISTGSSKASSVKGMIGSSSVSVVSQDSSSSSSCSTECTADDLLPPAASTDSTRDLLVPSTPNSAGSTVTISLSGVVSKAGVGTGRSDNERQFLFLNGRPVDNQKFNRCMNEVWRKYEMKQKPGFILDLRVPHGLFDVNVTPDKREVLLANEGLILDRLREAVDELYAPSRFTFRVATPDKRDPSVPSMVVVMASDKKLVEPASSTPKITSVKSAEDGHASVGPSVIALTNGQSGGVPGDRRSSSDGGGGIFFASSAGIAERVGSTGGKSEVRTPTSFAALVGGDSLSSSSSSSSHSRSGDGHVASASVGIADDGNIMNIDCDLTGGQEATPTRKGPSPTTTFYGAASQTHSGSGGWMETVAITTSSSSSSSDRKRPLAGLSVTTYSPTPDRSQPGKRTNLPSSFSSSSPSIEYFTPGDSIMQSVPSVASPVPPQEEYFDRLASTRRGEEFSQSTSSSSFLMSCSSEGISSSSSSSSVSTNQATEVVRKVTDLTGQDAGVEGADDAHFIDKRLGLDSRKNKGTMNFDVAALLEKMKLNPSMGRRETHKQVRDRVLGAYRTSYAEKQQQSASSSGQQLSGSAASMGGDEQSSRTLSKNDFTRMNVVGQFNASFIVTELDGDLFVLDQHACDEKFKFETLQRTTRIHQQPLLVPLTLETSVSMEAVIRDNLEVFEVNGFRLKVDDSPSLEERAELEGEEHWGAANFSAQNQTEQSSSSGSFISSTPKEGSKSNIRKGRIKILSVPFSKSVQFGADDVNELASMVGDSWNGGGPSESTDRRGRGGQSNNKNYLALKNDHVESSNGSLGRLAAEEKGAGGESAADKEQRLQRLAAKFRLPKLLAMFASRACRSAVMFGTTLSVQEIRGIVSRMEGLEQPWNCPHGRPTLRHLIDLKQL